jgi:hypothetical protein
MFVVTTVVKATAAPAPTVTSPEAYASDLHVPLLPLAPSLKHAIAVAGLLSSIVTTMPLVVPLLRQTVLPVVNDEPERMMPTHLPVLFASTKHAAALVALNVAAELHVETPPLCASSVPTTAACSELGLEVYETVASVAPTLAAVTAFRAHPNAVQVGVRLQEPVPAVQTAVAQSYPVSE